MKLVSSVLRTFLIFMSSLLILDGLLADSRQSHDFVSLLIELCAPQPSVAGCTCNMRFAQLLCPKRLPLHAIYGQHTDHLIALCP